MAETTGIGWTNATINFWIGCTPVGPGCERCYAAAMALRRWGIRFERGGERRPTQYAWTDPLKWNALRCEGATHMKIGKNKDGSPHIVPVPDWVFTMSLGDFMDKEADPALRARAWTVIRDTPMLRWQIVTKRVGLVERYLPKDWGDHGYKNVGIIATVIDQEEYERDAPKLHALYRLGVRWTGLSIEPQLGRVIPWHGFRTDWIITGGESSQSKMIGRRYDLEWARDLIRYGRATRTPVFVKQLGAQPYQEGTPFLTGKGPWPDPERWPEDLCVREMPRVYDEAA